MWGSFFCVAKGTADMDVCTTASPDGGGGGGPVAMMNRLGRVIINVPASDVCVAP